MGKSIVDLVMTALMAATMCVLGPFTFPLGPVPISLGSLGVYLSILLLGRKRGIQSIVIYLLLGLVGIPVFSGFSAGANILFGPTGGYLMGYLFLAMVSGWYLEKHKNGIKNEALALVLGTVGLYVWGTLWLLLITGIDWKSALVYGVLSFLLPDGLKIIIAIYLVRRIRKEYPIE